VRSPENIVEEIDILVNQYGIKNIGIADDNFIVNRKRTERICDMLIKGATIERWIGYVPSEQTGLMNLC